MAKTKRGARAAKVEDEDLVDAGEDEEEDEDEGASDRKYKRTKKGAGGGQRDGTLTFQAYRDPLTKAWEPDPVDSTVDIDREVVTEKDEQKASKLAPEEVKKLVTKMTRYILMRGSKKLPILRNKLTDAVMGEYKKLRITTFVLGEAQKLLRQVWGLDLVPAPVKSANEAFKGQQKDAMYLVYSKEHRTPEHAALLLPDDDDAELADRGLLMFVFSCIASTHEWKLREKELFRLLNKIDAGIPADGPLAPASDKRNRVDGLGNIAELFDKYVHQGYLCKARDARDEMQYELGPRAYVDVGRNQILQFQADALGQTLDVSILKEMQDNAKADDDDEEEAEHADEAAEAVSSKKSKKKKSTTPAHDDDEAEQPATSSKRKPAAKKPASKKK
eukprot:CAMPEP_0185706256 /NCGR_PEP_ID=MMETSP1164-20130828/21577_1 /TAXON_ID=1104430 /ORGANISM="Chrysoreinhardia sp, Strain CCMP2950" /LENGTH=388 /DNA_ID=CAMNT_0028373659 /DNA_START=17 /DNA_END=1183 /DNA_ORIENTATION=+